MKGWVKQLTRLRGYTDQMVEDANAVIFTFGSYRLGVSISSVCSFYDDTIPSASYVLPIGIFGWVSQMSLELIGV